MRSLRPADHRQFAEGRPRHRKVATVLVRLSILGLSIAPAPAAPAAIAQDPTAPAATTSSAPTASVEAQSRADLNLVTFDRVWALVADTHWDPELGGLDWEAVRDELRPQAAVAANDAALRGVLQEMVSRLGQSHFALLRGSDQEDGAASPFATRERFLAPGCPPSARAQIVAELDRRGAEDGEVGLDLRLLDGTDVVVTRLATGGPAAAAGVATGWKLIAIDGRPIAQRLSCFEAVRDSSYDQQLVRSWLRGLLAGPSGTAVRLRFDLGRRRERDVVLERAPPPGELVAFGNLPPSPLVFEITPAQTRRRAAIAVVRFNLWLLPIATAFERAMPELRQAAAIVIDLRGNPGGVSAIAQGVAGHFVDEPVSLGTMKGRRDELELVVNPRRVARDGSRVEPFAGPLAILLDDGSASTSELFAAGLRDHGRARLFGEPSAGAALPAVMDRLPNGDVFMHASMDYIRPNGERVEGRPIVPDVTTVLVRADLLAGKDEALRAALSWIDSELAKASTRVSTAPQAGGSGATP